jgi:predicted phosphoribosyltransferase
VEIVRRARLLRRGRPLISVTDRVCIVVDDGVATGSTLEASLRLVLSAGANRVVAAVPVGPPVTISRLKGFVDAVICPVQPATFFAVGAWYDDFGQVSDDTAISLLERRIDR